MGKISLSKVHRCFFSFVLFHFLKIQWGRKGNKAVRQVLQICCQPLVPPSSYFLLCLVHVWVAVSFTPTVCWANVNIGRNMQKGLGCSSLGDWSDPGWNPPTPIRSTAGKTIPSPSIPSRSAPAGAEERAASARGQEGLTAASTSAPCSGASLCALNCGLRAKAEPPPPAWQEKHSSTLSAMWGGLARHCSSFQLFLSHSHVFLFVAELRKLWHLYSQNIVLTSESHQHAPWQLLPLWSWASFFVTK